MQSAARIAELVNVKINFSELVNFPYKVSEYSLQQHKWHKLNPICLRIVYGPSQEDSITLSSFYLINKNMILDCLSAMI